MATMTCRNTSKLMGRITLPLWGLMLHNPGTHSIASILQQCHAGHNLIALSVGSQVAVPAVRPLCLTVLCAAGLMAQLQNRRLSPATEKSLATTRWEPLHDAGPTQASCTIVCTARAEHSVCPWQTPLQHKHLHLLSGNHSEDIVLPITFLYHAADSGKERQGQGTSKGCQ